MTIDVTRRRLLALGAGLIAMPMVPSRALRTGLGAQQQQQGAAQRPADQLYNPEILERRDASVTETANDATVKAAERKLACPCPCTLDVFTCRTTDFTCSYSPERHREVVALVEGQGMNVDQVLDAMVDKYGQEALMAPIPRGFNIVGYVLPASVILGLGAILTALLALRQRKEAVAVAISSAPAPRRPSASADELARIEAELRELEP